MRKCLAASSSPPSSSSDIAEVEASIREAQRQQATSKSLRARSKNHEYCNECVLSMSDAARSNSIIGCSVSSGDQFSIIF